MEGDSTAREGPARVARNAGIFIDVREQFGRQMSALVANSGLLSSTKLLANIDLGSVVTPLLQGAMASIAHSALGESMVSASLAAQFAGINLKSVLATIPLVTIDTPLLAAHIKSIEAMSTLVDQRTHLLASFKPLPEVAHPVVHATEAWKRTIRSSEKLGSETWLDRIEIVGRGTGWAIQSGIALTEDDPVEVEQLHSDAVAVLGPAQLSAELAEHLSGLNVNLAAKWNGVWERILHGGDDASSQAANSLMECVDWTLRTVSPDGDVLPWHQQCGLPADLLHKGKPTRSLRLRFAIRNQPEKEFALPLFLKTVAELVSAIEGRKHRLEINPERALIPLVLTAQGFLLFLLAD